MDFEVHCMFILLTKLSLFNYDKVKIGFAINDSFNIQDVDVFLNREALTLLLDTFHNEAESFLLSEVTYFDTQKFSLFLFFLHQC